MKFVSVLLVAMIAMMLVVPALSDCIAHYLACSGEDCCDVKYGWSCKFDEGGKRDICMPAARSLDLGDCVPEGGSCKLGGTKCCGWNEKTRHSCQYVTPVTPDWAQKCQNGEFNPHPQGRSAMSQVRKSLLSALNMLEDN